jgi:hypothetical protein
MGLAACQAEADMFSGPELYDSIMGLDFSGASGYVSFLPERGMRDARHVDYVFGNLMMYNISADYEARNQTWNDTYTWEGGVFTGDFAGEFAPKLRIQSTTGSIVTQDELKYPTDITTPPTPFFIPVNLVPVGVNAFCWVLAGLIIATSLGFGVWVFLNRKQHKVKASQPIFLVLLCSGTFLIGCSTIFVPFQEDIIFNDYTLGILCMLNVWLLSLGTYYVHL